MAQQWCPRCAATVEETGGFCLLGHSVAAPGGPGPAPVGNLRAEVDRAFEDARSQIAALHVAGQAPGAVDQPAGRASTVERPVAGPPPPPPPPPADTQRHSIWTALEGEQSGNLNDPINAFAPPPRMDWGPQKALGKVSLRRWKANPA